MQISRYYEDRIPRNPSVLVVSNHRSFMDVLVLMTAPSSPIRFACHQDLLILPVAIASLPKINTAAFPLRLLSLFDPSEPLFNQPGWHPLVIYHRVAVLIGRPYCVNVVMSEELGVRSKIRFFSALSASSAVKKSFI